MVTPEPRNPGTEAGMKFFMDGRADTNYLPSLAVYRTQELTEGDGVHLRRKEEVQGRGATGVLPLLNCRAL